MKYDSYGQAYVDSQELCDLLYCEPDLDLSLFKVRDPDVYNEARRATFSTDLPELQVYEQVLYKDLTEFDNMQQSHWNMPIDYCTFDIAQWLLNQCKTQVELQRVGEELLLYQDRDLFNLLRYIKYMVDTFRKNDIVWGLGRGSSVASYVLYLIGVHKIDSIYYDLNIDEFLR